MKANEQNHNYMKNQKNKLRIRLEEIEISLKKQAETKEKNEQKYGKYPDQIIIGENDRVKGDSPQNIENEEKRVSYAYGYYERGSRVLEGYFANGVFTDEEQRNFGVIDYIHNIPDQHIKNLKNYPAYLEGRVYQMGKVAYDFCIENNMNLETYIQLMEIIYPEIQTPSFIEGYEKRKNEFSKTGHK